MGAARGAPGIDGGAVVSVNQAELLDLLEQVGVDEEVVLGMRRRLPVLSGEQAQRWASLLDGLESCAATLRRDLRNAFERGRAPRALITEARKRLEELQFRVGVASIAACAERSCSEFAERAAESKRALEGRVVALEAELSSPIALQSRLTTLVGSAVGVHVEWVN